MPYLPTYFLISVCQCCAKKSINALTTVCWQFLDKQAAHKSCPDDNEGDYRIGSNTFFTNDAGESKVSVTDYATAMVDEAQNAAHVNNHISIAY